MLRCVMVLLAVAACGTHPTKLGAAPSWRGRTDPGSPPRPTAEAVVFAPSSPGAAMYNRALERAASSPLGDAVVRAVADAAKAQGVPPPFADARLFRACEELAQVVPEQGVVTYRVVEFALQRNGLIEPSPHLLVVWGDLDNPQLIVDQLSPGLAEMFERGAPARVGIGAAVRSPDGAGAVVFALQASAVTTNPIPRSLPEDGAFRLEGSVRRPFRDPEVLITGADGHTARLPLVSGTKPSSFRAELSCAGRAGRQQVEINASDATGSTVLANFPIWCGEAPPTTILVEDAGADPAPANAQEAEQRLLALANAARRAAGLPELQWSEPVAEVARRYSEEMRRTQVVAHLSPTTGSAADRLRAAKIKSSLVLENVARAYGVAETHAGLMDSPGHRQNLMSPLATHVGIGVVLGDQVSGRPAMFVTEVFTRVTPRIDERDVAAALHTRLANGRLPRAAALENLAQRVAESLARGQPRERAWDPVSADLKALSKTYRKVASVVTAVSDLSSIDTSTVLTGVVDELGIGVAQGPHPEIGDGAIWIVLLLGERPRS
ncbi:MAG: CAP domain-containing protein [Kofleriaceae bacterium]